MGVTARLHKARACKECVYTRRSHLAVRVIMADTLFKRYDKVVNTLAWLQVQQDSAVDTPDARQTTKETLKQAIDARLNAFTTKESDFEKDVKALPQTDSVTVQQLRKDKYNVYLDAAEDSDKGKKKCRTKLQLSPALQDAQSVLKNDQEYYATAKPASFANNAIVMLQYRAVIQSARQTTGDVSASLSTQALIDNDMLQRAQVHSLADKYIEVFDVLNAIGFYVANDHSEDAAASTEDALPEIVNRLRVKQDEYITTFRTEETAFLNSADKAESVDDEKVRRTFRDGGYDIKNLAEGPDKEARTALLRKLPTLKLINSPQFLNNATDVHQLHGALASIKSALDSVPQNVEGVNGSLESLKGAKERAQSVADRMAEFSNARQLQKQEDAARRALLIEQNKKEKQAQAERRKQESYEQAQAASKAAAEAAAEAAALRAAAEKKKKDQSEKAMEKAIEKAKANFAEMYDGVDVATYFDKYNNALNQFNGEFKVYRTQDAANSRMQPFKSPANYVGSTPRHRKLYDEEWDITRGLEHKAEIRQRQRVFKVSPRDAFPEDAWKTFCEGNGGEAKLHICVEYRRLLRERFGKYEKWSEDVVCNAGAEAAQDASLSTIPSNLTIEDVTFLKLVAEERMQQVDGECAAFQKSVQRFIFEQQFDKGTSDDFGAYYELFLSDEREKTQYLERHSDELGCAKYDYDIQLGFRKQADHKMWLQTHTGSSLGRALTFPRDYTASLSAGTDSVNYLWEPFKKGTLKLSDVLPLADDVPENDVFVVHLKPEGNLRSFTKEQLEALHAAASDTQDQRNLVMTNSSPAVVYKEGTPLEQGTYCVVPMLQSAYRVPAAVQKFKDALNKELNIASSTPDDFVPVEAMNVDDDPLQDQSPLWQSQYHTVAVTTTYYVDSENASDKIGYYESELLDGMLKAREKTVAQMSTALANITKKLEGAGASDTAQLQEQYNAKQTSLEKARKVLVHVTSLVEARQNKLKSQVEAVEGLRAAQSETERQRLKTARDAQKEAEARARAEREEAIRLQKAEQRQEKAQEKQRLKNEKQAAMKEAQRTRTVARKARMQAQLAERTDRLLGDTAQESVSLALAFAAIDADQQLCQERFDTLQTTLEQSLREEALSAKQFPWHSGDIPKQKCQTRVTSTDGIHASKLQDDGSALQRQTYYPEYQSPFSVEQHSLLFVTETEAFYGSAQGETPTTDSVESAEFAATRELQDVDAPSEAAIRTSLLQRVKEEDVISSDAMLFNKVYARHLLRKHLSDIDEDLRDRRESKKDADVGFVNISTCLGDIHTTDGNVIDSKKLDNVVTQLLPSFECMLRYRNTVLKFKEIEIENELLLQADSKSVRYAAMRKELRLIKQACVPRQWGEVAAKRMIASLYGKLPGQLHTPQPLYMPLRISAPPRVGKSATSILLASLAKRVGMLTLYSVAPHKIVPINEIQSKLCTIGWRSVRSVKTEATSRGVDLKAALNDIVTSYNWASIDDSSIDTCHLDAKEKHASKKTDMLLYSSDELGDVARASALMGSLRLTNTVVFHIRDEAQRLAKEETNKFVPNHSEFVPSPPILHFLRSCYNNAFGLNCLVSATMFPTLLETDLWGYIGTTRQNVQNALPPSASLFAMQRKLGFSCLPTVVPALKPPVPPNYMGVEYLRTWTFKKTPEEKMPCNAHAKEGQDAYLQYGSSYSAAWADNTVRTVEEAGMLREAAKMKISQKTKSATEQLQTMQLRETRHSALTRAQALLGEPDNESDTADAATTSRPSSLPEGSDWEPSEDESDYEDDQGPKPATSKKAATKAKRKAERKRLAAELVEQDAFTIAEHFKDWLECEEEPVVEVLGENQKECMLVPMYIGALNNHVADTAMLSFVRHFAMLAHKRTLDKVKAKTTKKGGLFGAPPNIREHGVAFCLFSSVYRKRDDLIGKSGGIRIIDRADSAFESTVAVDATALACFVYNPVALYDKRTGKYTDYTKQADEPDLDVFFAANAKEAINKLWSTTGVQISKVAILGYGMLQAGLTVQTFVSPNRIYCPRHVAVATAETAALDVQLQMVGRAFADLRAVTRPPVEGADSRWRIELLSVPGMATRLQEYSAMETILADVNEKGKPISMCEALKRSFTRQLMQVNAYGTLGTVGVRRGDFASILGLDAAEARKQSLVAKKLRTSKAPPKQVETVQTELAHGNTDAVVTQLLNEATETGQRDAPPEQVDSVKEQLQSRGTDGLVDATLDDGQEQSSEATVTGQGDTPMPNTSMAGEKRTQPEMPNAATAAQKSAKLNAVNLDFPDAHSYYLHVLNAHMRGWQ